MNTNKTTLSNIRIYRMREQGYFFQSNQELSDLAFGNRFAYRLCGGLLTLGVLTANIPLLVAMMSIAFLSLLLPYHPFDYIYNKLLAGKMRKPQIPPRSMQLKFACLMATIWIGVIIFFFSTNHILGGYIMGSALIIVAALVGYWDLCIPSKIYNMIVLTDVEHSENFNPKSTK